MSAEKQTEVQLIAKRFSIIFIPLVLILSIIFFLFYNTEANNYKELLKTDTLNEATHMVAVIKTQFQLVFSDLMFLSEQNELQRALDTNETLNWENLAAEYLSFSAKKQIYDQIRFIDETGMEIVRVNFNDGNPVIVPHEQLQSKAKRYYFEDTFVLAQGEVFVSPMDLNIEHGEIEQPLKQMIRFGTPIFDRDGHKRGVVILNYLAENMTHDLELTPSGHGQIMLLNSDGYWLHNPNPEDEWGFMYPEKEDRTFGNAFPEAWLTITADESGQFFNTDGLFTYTTIYPLLEGQKSSIGSGSAFEPSAQQIGAKEYYWKFVAYAPSSMLSAATGPILNSVLLIFALMVVVVAGGSWVGARAMVRRKQAEEALQKAKDDLEVRVEQRTYELKITNEQLIEEISQHKLARDRVEHLNLVLQAIRSVNQLIVKEKDRDRLFKSTCDSLIKNRGYYSAWLISLDESGGFLGYAESGFGEDFLPMVEQLKRGELPTCCQQALRQAGVVAIKNPSSTCSSDCLLVKKCHRNGVLAIRLEYSEKVYGLLVTSVPIEFIEDEEEHSLFQEVAGDIAFALYDIELEQKHKQAEEALQSAEQNFRNSLDNSPLGIRIVSAEGELLYANQAILDIYGYSSVEELEAVPTKQRFTPESYAEYQERKERRKLGKPVPPNYEISIIRKDGGIRHLIVSRKEVVWGGEVQYQVIHQDITERKQAEYNLGERVKELTCLYGVSQLIAITDVSLDEILRGTVDLIPAGWQYPEVTCARVTFKGKEFKTDNFRITEWKQSSNIQVKGEMLGTLEVYYLEERPEFDEGPFLKEERNLIDGLVSMLGEITERKQAEENIKKAAEEWKTTFDSITDLVSVHDKDFKLVRVNRAFAKTVKMEPKELIGKTCYEIIHGTNEPASNCPHKRTLKDKKPHRLELFEPHLGIHLEMSTSPIFDDKGEIIGAVHITKDISERKKMEEQLIITDRLASIGELSSGIAHEINNPLTGIIGFAQLLLDKDLSDDVREDLEVINREALRTAGIVKGLLTFARKHVPEKQAVDINDIIQTVLGLRAYEQKVSNIEVNTRFASDLPEITADGFQLQQVFLNIIINAEHFMTEAHRRGTLTITTERVGDIIRTSFADDGPGITKENLKHLFDPFFTTKEVGKGTGLGLSICHGIVVEHGGRIYAESKLGKGATFIVELPIREH